VTRFRLKVDSLATTAPERTADYTAAQMGHLGVAHDDAWPLPWTWVSVGEFDAQSADSSSAHYWSGSDNVELDNGVGLLQGRCPPTTSGGLASAALAGVRAATQSSTYQAYA
jgi:hypothetical protein